MKGNPWILLALVLLLCAPPMLINVGKPDPVRIMEVLSFMTSQETWLRIHHGESEKGQRRGGLERSGFH